MFGVSFFGTNFFGEAYLAALSSGIIPQVPNGKTSDIAFLQKGNSASVFGNLLGGNSAPTINVLSNGKVID